MKHLLSIKVELLKLELLTIRQLRWNPVNCVTKNSAISERISELEKSIEEIRGVLQ
jgi:hypothetical protein